MGLTVGVLGNAKKQYQVLWYTGYENVKMPTEKKKGGLVGLTNRCVQGVRFLSQGLRCLQALHREHRVVVQVGHLDSGVLWAAILVRGHA